MLAQWADTSWLAGWLAGWLADWLMAPLKSVTTEISALVLDFMKLPGPGCIGLEDFAGSML